MKLLKFLENTVKTTTSKYKVLNRFFKNIYLFLSKNLLKQLLNVKKHISKSRNILA